MSKTKPTFINFFRIICFLAFIIILQILPAQNDQHYNSIQYGLRGTIMNGAMVAGVNDNSALFYNPAAMSISDDEGLDVSLFTVSIDLLKQKNAFGGGNDAKSSGFKFVPGLVTYNKSPFKNKNIKVGAGIITRHNFQNEFSGRVTEDMGDAYRVNSIRYNYAAREFWVALAVAYKFKKNVTLGASQYISFRNDHYEHDVNYMIIDQVNPGEIIFLDKEDLVFDQDQRMGLLNKIGMTWNNDIVKFGVTLTTPTYVNLIRSSSVNYERTYIGVDSSYAESVDFENKGRQKNPFSAAAGLELNFKGYLVAASVEYYHKVKVYDMISSAGEDLVPGLQTSPFEIKDSRKKVFNINVGWEIPLNNKFSYLGGLRTNFNYNNKPTGYAKPGLHFSYFDIYHVSTGLKMQFGQSSITTGIDYAFSFNDNLPVLADLNAPSLPNISLLNSSVAYNNLTFMITYNFLLEKLKKVID